jgi:hypothetical protein
VVEPQFTHCLHDCITCGATGLQRAVIEQRLDLYEPAKFIWSQRFAAGESTPGEACGAAGKRFLHGVGRHGHRPRKVIELDLPVLHAHEAEIQRAQGSPEARIGGQCLKQGIGLHQTLRQTRHLALGQVQQAVSLKKWAALHLVHRPKTIGALSEGIGEPCRCLIGELRGRRIDNDEHFRLRKRLHEFESVLRPRQIVREKVLDVRLDREMAHGINR